MNLNDLKIVLKEKKQEIENYLEKLMKEYYPPLSKTLQEAMEYSLFSGGKRIRPILTELVSEMLGGSMEEARKTGSAIELIHTYSLIHDDLPSMDDDDLRRGKPTNHRVYGPGIAILAGDGLLTLAFNILSNLKLSTTQTLKIIKLISKGAGPKGMVGGQVLDLEAEEKQLSLDKLKKVHQAKTGGLFRASILGGALCANPADKEVQALETYAYNLGLLFQVTDDVLDVVGDSKKLGKKSGQDKRLNKSTYPSLLGLEGARSEAISLAEKAKNSLSIFDNRADLLLDLVDFVLNREH